VASKEAAGGQRDRHIRAVAKKGRMAWRGLVPIVAEAAAVMPARRATVVPSRALMPNWPAPARWRALRRAPPARR
jgi:hypothetical protein